MLCTRIWGRRRVKFPRMADRQIEVIVDDSVGEKGNSFLTVEVVGNERVVAGMAVPRVATPKDISEALKKNAESTESQESRDLLNQAAELVPGLKKK